MERGRRVRLHQEIDHRDEGRDDDDVDGDADLIAEGGVPGARGVGEGLGGEADGGGFQRERAAVRGDEFRDALFGAGTQLEAEELLESVWVDLVLAETDEEYNAIRDETIRTDRNK